MQFKQLFRNTAVGIAGGLGAAWTMDKFQNSWNAFQKHAWEDDRSADGQEDEPATVKTADMVAKAVARERLPKQYRNTAGQAVHYGFGAFLGGLYSALGTRFPAVRTGFGMVYGAGVAVAADELLVPAAGLAPPAIEVPPSTHLYSLASHLVFGAALEVSRRAMEKAANAPKARVPELIGKRFRQDPIAGK